jgi:hypothetical protein
MIKKKKYLGAAGDYAKYELACIKELSKLLKQTYKKTLQTVNLDNSLLKIISVNFDKKVTVKETAKELKAALIKVAKKNPLDSFIEILSKLPKKQTETIKPKFPMKLPATVTIGKVKKRSRRITGSHTDNKSHNVKINVLSGIKDNKDIIEEINLLNALILNFKNSIKEDLKNLKKPPYSLKNNSYMRYDLRQGIAARKKMLKIQIETLKHLKKLLKLNWF